MPRDTPEQARQDAPRDDLRALLVTGGLGVGKTTVLAEIAEVLDARGEPYAAVDLDWLCWTGPEVSGAELSAVLRDALAAVWAVYRRRGARRLVLARALASRAERAAVADALPGVGLTVVRLRADPAAVRARLAARPGRSGADDADGAAQLEAAICAAGAHDAVVDEVPGDPAGTSQRVLAAAGWA